MKALFYASAILISISLAFYIFYKSKNNNLNQKYQKIAKFILFFTSGGWIFWTLGISTFIIGYPITGWLFNFQLSFIFIVIIVCWLLYRNKMKDKSNLENKDVVINELKEKLSLAEQDNKILDNQALEEALRKKLKSSLFAINEVQEHRTWLINSIKSSKFRICILSGWATSYVIDNDFKLLIKEALKRGVKVYLGFGYQSSDKKINTKFEDKAAKLLWELREWCQNIQGDGEIEVFEFANHAKVLIKDDEYVVIGSFNWLSNAKGRNLERSWVVKDKFLVDNEFDEVHSIMDELRKVEKRHFIKKFLPGILKK